MLSRGQGHRSVYQVVPLAVPALVGLLVAALDLTGIF